MKDEDIMKDLFGTPITVGDHIAYSRLHLAEIAKGTITTITPKGVWVVEDGTTGKFWRSREQIVVVGRYQRAHDRLIKELCDSVIRRVSGCDVVGEVITGGVYLSVRIAAEVGDTYVFREVRLSKFKLEGVATSISDSIVAELLEEEFSERY